MSSHIYITDLSKPSDLSKFRSTFNSNSISTMKMIEENRVHPQKMKDTVQKLKKESEIKAKFNESFLDFLIQDKTHFADFNKIEEHYTQMVIKNYSIYNNNKIIIEKKKKEEEGISNEITANLLSNFYFLENELMNSIEKKVNDIKRLIKLKELELDCYKNAYTRAYKTNYLIFKRYEDETKYEKIHEEQFQKYKILKDHAVNTVTKQSEMLKSMKEFYDFSEMTYKNEILQKTKLYNQLDFEVLMIKKDTASIENALNKKIEQQNEKKTQISRVKLINKKTYEDYLGIFRDYHRTNLKLLEIYKILNVKNLYNVITQFNVLRKENQLLHFRFKKVNGDIAKINMELTLMNKEIESIKEQTEIRKNGNFKSQDDYITEILSKTKTQKYFNILLGESFKEKENLIKLIMNFLNNYITKIVKSLKNPILQHNFTIKANLEKYQKFFSSNTKIHKQPHDKRTYFNFDSLFARLDKYCFRFVCEFYITFVNDFYILLSNSLNYVCLFDVMNKLEDHEMINTHNRSTHLKKKKIQIIGFFSTSSVKLYLSHINQAIKKQMDKAQIFSRSEKEILEAKKTKEIIDQKDITESKYQNLITSGKELYKVYIDYCKKKNTVKFDEDTHRFIKLHPQRSVSLIEKYTNDLVSDRVEQIIKDRRRKEIVMNKSALIKSEQEEIELNRLLKLKNTKRKNEREEEEFDLDEDEYLNKQKIEMERLSEELKRQKIRKKYAMCSPNVELNQIYMRLNDLRNLELNYGSEKEKNLVNSAELNEIYYNFRKKFYPSAKNSVLRKKTIQSKKKSQSVNSSKRNDISIPSLSNKSLGKKLWDKDNFNNSIRNQASSTSRDKINASFCGGAKSNNTGVTGLDTEFTNRKRNGSRSTAGIRNALGQSMQSIF